MITSVTQSFCLLTQYTRTQWSALVNWFVLSCLGLIHFQVFGNRIHGTFMLTFFVWFFLQFFHTVVIKYSYLIQIIYRQSYGLTRLLALWVESSPMVWETGVQSLVESYQSLKKMVLHTAFHKTQHYKVRIKGKVGEFREWISAIPSISLW